MVSAPPNDWRLAGPLQPMRFEATVEDCVVSEGEIPEGLVGGLYRSGPTWKRPTRQGCNGWWTMDGMVQALTFDGEGRVDFRNRWIRTPKYRLEEQHGRSMFEWSDGFDDWRSYGFGEVTNRDRCNAGVPVGTSWVNAFPFQGDVVVSGEQSSPPIRIDPITLETKGFVAWSPQLSPGFVKPAGYGDGAFTPHPKWDAATGELYGWTYRDVAPYATLHWVKPDGSVRTRHLDEAPHGTILHDAWLTPTYMVLPFMPLIGDLKRCERGLSIYDWDTSLPIVIGLVRRDDFDGPVRWIDTGLEPQYIMHTLSANEVDGVLQLDAPIYDRPPLQRWTSGHATLIGDAAHPMVPHLGQGAGQAIEDAYTLGVLLNGASVESLSERLATYERLRRPRTAFVQSVARLAGKFYRTDFRDAGQRNATMGSWMKEVRGILEHDADAAVVAAR